MDYEGTSLTVVPQGITQYASPDRSRLPIPSQQLSTACSGLSFTLVISKLFHFLFLFFNTEPPVNLNSWLYFTLSGFIVKGLSSRGIFDILVLINQERSS